jgi:DNA-binding NtrC family response regulator
MVGQSPPMLQVRRLIRKLGRATCPVLILGETGTGKEVVARAIHQEASQCPFVVVDCAAMVSTLLESELFGHAAGAFTGATKARRGLIEEATGGIAFFDEVGELPLEYQSKLLRLLQCKEFRPVGSLTTKRIDFRIVAATNLDLAGEVEAKRFREDLYYRLNVGTIYVPPLRERKDDIPSLIDHFLRKLETNHRPTPQCIEAMLSYPWPGNVRELECCIRRLVAVHTGPLLPADVLPDYIRYGSDSRKENQGRATEPGKCNTLPWPSINPPAVASGLASLAETEELAIRTTLEATKGDCAAAARILGIGRTTLYRKKLQYELKLENPKARETAAGL